MQTRGSVHGKTKELCRFFPEHIEEGMRLSARKLIEEALRAEVELVIEEWGQDEEGNTIMQQRFRPVQSNS